MYYFNLLTVPVFVTPASKWSFTETQLQGAAAKRINVVQEQNYQVFP